MELAKEAAPLDAWQLVEHVLCRSFARGKRYILNHMPKLVVWRAYGTGEARETVELVERTAAVMTEGQAWDASAGYGRRGISIHFWKCQLTISTCRTPTGTSAPNDCNKANPSGHAPWPESTLMCPASLSRTNSLPHALA